ncbi:phytanoyl-CoA dioxygenase family protein [soil metagenome]
MMQSTEQFERDGYCLIAGVFDATAMADAVRATTTLLAGNDTSVLKGSSSPAYGARNLLQLWPASVQLLQLPRLQALLGSLLGLRGGVVRVLYFDKPPGHSWALPWHRDQTIAVKVHRDSTVFMKPTMKAGVPHVEAPRSLLETMVTVRIHLDPMWLENGALRVVPGSHRNLQTPATQDARTIECSAGDVLLMRPLLLHASGHSEVTTALHRRIVHLECAMSSELPDGFEWHDFVSITPC